MAISDSVARYIFRTFTFKALLLYCTVFPFSGSSLTPKRMTFNDLEWSFYVKILSELGIQWVGVLAFGDNCSEICRTTHYIVSGKNVAQLGTELYW